MVSARNVTPWHGLGTIVNVPALSAEEALRLAKLGWTVEQEKIFDSDMTTIPSHVLNRRSDTREILGVVPSTWSVIQNSTLAEIAEALGQVEGADFKPVIETAGSLRGGRVVWMLIQVSFGRFAGSEHKQYLLLSNGHDGKRALRGTLTDVRVVCANTLGAAETSNADLYVIHSGDVKVRIENAINLLGWATSQTKATFGIYEALRKFPLNPDAALDYFGNVLKRDVNDEDEEPNAEAVAKMLDLFRNGPGNEGKNLFDGLNAVTDFVDHHKGFRDDETVAERKMLATAIAGRGVALKKRALNLASALVG